MPLFFFNNKKQKTYWQIGNAILFFATVIVFIFRFEIRDIIGDEGEEAQFAVAIFPTLLLLWVYLGSTILENLGVGKD